MALITYPLLPIQAAIGVTAPSSGVNKKLHGLLIAACKRMEEKGYRVIAGETPWMQHKAKSASAKKRGQEFNEMIQDPKIDAIIPPWGGELLIEMLEEVDFDQIPNKWVLGYSDLSVLLLAITLKTGIATAHGTNLIDLRGEYSDETTKMWEKVLSLKKGETIIQHSSANFQLKWEHAETSPCVFHLTEKTEWKTASGNREKVSGRLLGGCIDVISHLAGTPYGDVKSFREKYIKDEPVIWYLENCELSAAALRRCLVQMKYAGWFENCSGFLFGRSAANEAVDGYTAEDIYHELSEEFSVPVIYDIDCGHQPPQITFVNGAKAEIEAENGTGKVTQFFL